MSYSIGTQYSLSSSIFSHPESYLSANTEWAFDDSIKVENGGEQFDDDGRQKHSRQIGRPPNKWTCMRLRKLIRLYLLTDLELDSIIDRLRTDDFQPCKRNVQEKLNRHLQPQPNKIRPKGDTKIFRRLLFECNTLQKSRRIRKQRHRERREQEERSCKESVAERYEEGIALVTTQTAGDFSCIPAGPPTTIEPINYEESPFSAEALGLPVPCSSLVDEQDNSFLASVPNMDVDIPTPQVCTSTLEVPGPLLGWDSVDSGLLPLRPFHALEKNDPSHHNYPSGDDYDINALFPDILFDSSPEPPFFSMGFDSDFGPRAAATSTFPPSRNETTDGFNALDGMNEGLPGNLVSELTQPIPLSDSQGKCPAVNSTHLRDSLNAEYSLLSGTSCYDFDIVTTIAPKSRPISSSNQDHAEPAVCSSITPRTFKSSISITDTSSISRRSSFSSSKISSLLSRMSLSSNLLDVQICPKPTSSSTRLSIEVNTPLIMLPGIFPEFCWHHMNKNRLRHCSEWDGSHMCYSKHHRTSTPTHRSFRVDIFSRIVQSTIRRKDIHEIDTFGNSVIHIATTMLSPPSYLISLIKMGANVNSLNNAGQTFLHLVKPEILSHYIDFCNLLEILSARNFNFRQLDHLGQSPLHLLLRPWILSDILQAIITKLHTLLLHRHISTARDCFGYTVVGQMNLQDDRSSGLNLDQTLLSLACETEKHIIDPRELQPSKFKGWQEGQNSKDDISARNYENHPFIERVDDLLQYEQHVDYWRTIVAANKTPSVEESNGRNGLHCLAASSLVSKDMPLPTALLIQLENLTARNFTDTSNERVGLVKSLLDAGVDPNNYDNGGNTPLMAFVSNNHTYESEESVILILNLLLERGGDINRRNRQGETPLHLSIKLGRRAATGVLLASGANIHARTSHGLGVIELGQKHCLENKEDGNLFGQIMVCMSLAASFGAVSEPTILDEWGSPEWRINSQVRGGTKGFKLVKKFIGGKVRGRKGKKCLGVKTSAL